MKTTSRSLHHHCTTQMILVRSRQILKEIIPVPLEFSKVQALKAYQIRKARIAVIEMKKIKTIFCADIRSSSIVVVFPLLCGYSTSFNRRNA